MEYFENKAYIIGNSHPTPKNEMEKIIEQMNQINISICKISAQNATGTGFFCKIPISEEDQNEEYFLGLITCKTF